jgi:hypothetical protein
MSNKRVRPKAAPVRIKLPEWMMGGDPKEVGRVCGWTVETTEEDGVWLMGSKEGAHGTNGDLLRIFKLADRSNAHAEGAFSRIRRLKRYDGISGDHLWSVARQAHSRLVEHFPEESAAMLVSMQMLLSASRTAAEAELITQEAFREYLLPSADNPSVYLVEVSDTLSYRFTATRTLLATKDDVTSKAFKAEGLISRSSKGLFSDTSLGFSAYLACMCASLSPAVWAYPIGRPGGVILLLFGEAMAGQEPLARDKIQLLSPDRRRRESDPTPPSNPKIYIKAAEWWVEQLSTLFSIITEPANYVDDDVFNPAEATERLLSVEQLFRDCQSILTLTRDDHARTSLAFTLLKRLEGLIPGYRWKTVVGRSSLEAIVEKLRTDVPTGLHDVFLRRAERAVRAVAALEHGFFAAGEDPESPIYLPDKNGIRVATDRRHAVTEWLQLVRNSLHGFDKPSERDRALLAAHDGDIPGDFADVAWLHLLDIVANPDKLAKFARRRKMNTGRPRRDPVLRT